MSAEKARVQKILNVLENDEAKEALQKVDLDSGDSMKRIVQAMKYFSDLKDPKFPFEDFLDVLDSMSALANGK